MDASVDVFAEGVKADPELAGGFNAFGLSQGNNLIRGYIQKYAGEPGYPAVSTFMSINGINAGVGAFPNCAPDAKLIGGICAGLTEILGDLAYNSFVQGILFQANYFRDPSKTDSDKYKKYSQLAQWENEGDDVDQVSTRHADSARRAQALKRVEWQITRAAEHKTTDPERARSEEGPPGLPRYEQPRCSLPLPPPL